MCGFSVWERWIGNPQCSADGDWRIGGLSRSLSLRRDSCRLMLAVMLPLEVALCPVRLWCSGLSTQLFPRSSSRGLKCPVTVTVTGGELRSSPLPWQWPSLRRPGTRRRRASVRFRCLKRGRGSNKAKCTEKSDYRPDCACAHRLMKVSGILGSVGDVSDRLELTSSEGVVLDSLSVFWLRVSDMASSLKYVIQKVIHSSILTSFDQNVLKCKNVISRFVT